MTKQRRSTASRRGGGFFGTLWRWTKRLLVAGLHARHVLVGDDFRFGAERRGTVEALAEAGARHGFDVTEVQPVLADGERISSTAIRAALGSTIASPIVSVLVKESGARFYVIGEVTRPGATPSSRVFASLCR